MGTFESLQSKGAFCDGAGDECGALLLQQSDQPFLLRHQRINLRRLPVEEGRDTSLLRQWRNRNSQ